MTKRTKNLLRLIVSIIFSGIFFIAIISIVKVNVNLDLTKVAKLTGHVIDAKVISHTPTATKIKSTRKVFFIKLEGSEEEFATYRPNQDYSKLIEEIKIGDTVTVYYKPNRYNEINLNIFQITKGEKILQDYLSYNNNHKIIAWATGFAIVLTLAIGLYPYYKNYRRRKIQERKNSS